jgi:hypothetical protein
MEQDMQQFFETKLARDFRTREAKKRYALETT